MANRNPADVIKSGQIDLLRYLWCDNSSIIRVKSLYLPGVLDEFATAGDDALLAALEDRVTISAALQALPGTKDEPAPEAGLAPVQEIRLVPAWETLALSTAEHAVAEVSTSMYLGASRWEHCPRAFLQRMVDRLQQEHGLRLETGFEIEFYLLRPNEDPQVMPQPVDRTVFAQGLAAQVSQTVIADLLRALWGQDVPIEQVLPESGPGQQEITMAHSDPMLLASRLLRARQTIHATALEYGLVASFLPLIFENAAGSGLHTHMSLWRGKQSITAAAGEPYGISGETNAFLAGVLEHLPSLMAVTTPTRTSYRRIRPHAWSGAYQVWGIDNKEAALRLVGDPLSGVPSNAELKTVDATANPYLALGCLIAAGMDGLARDLRLPEPCEVDPGSFTPIERDQRGIRALPAAAEGALSHFSADAVLAQAMGKEMARVFAAVRRFELQSLAGLSFEDERMELLQRY